MVRRRRDQSDTRRGVAHLGHPRVHLVTRKLSALTGFRALGHLDLDIGAVGQVVRGDPEAAGGHLLDRAAPPVAVGVAVEPAAGLAALARVRPPAKAVHRDRQGLVRLGGDRAVAHRARGEALDDLTGRFDLLDRNRGPPAAFCVLELQQPAQRGHQLALDVDQRGVLLEHRILPGAGRVLQLEHGVGVEQVVLALTAPLVLPADLEFAVRALVGAVQVGQLVASGDVRGDVVEVDAADRAGQPGEVLVEHALRDADGLEQLRAGVGGHRGDAHLRHHLQHTLAGGLDVVRQRLLAVHAAQRAAVEHVLDRFEGDVGVDGGGAEADQHRHVVDLAGVAGLDDQSDLRTGALPNQVVVDRRDGQQRRDRRQVLVGLAVGDHQDAGAVLDRLRRRVPDVVERTAQALTALGDRIQTADDRRAHAVLVAADLVVGVEVDQLGQFVVTQYRLRQHDLVA